MHSPRADCSSTFARHVSSRRRTTTAAGAVVLLALLLAGCGSDASSGSGTGDRPLVVATTTQLADFATVIGGDDVEVHGLLRPNLDAHDYEPTPADIDALARADVILANGVGLEPWLDAAVDASGTGTDVTDTSRGAHFLTTSGDHDHGEDEADHEEEADAHEASENPHIWLDPENARVMAGNVADALAAAAPDDDAAIEERAAAYDEELVALDEEIRTRLDGLDDRRIVTDHDAFPYFAAHYDLEVVGSIITSFDSSAEVSAGDLQELADAIEAEGVRAVFTEQSLPPDAAEALARLVDVTVVSGDDGLYADSLGPPGSSGATYLDMMRHNASTIERHLR